MSVNLIFSSFTCKTAGCVGELSPKTTEGVILQVGCNSSNSAVACPVCKRVHWPRGNVARNRQLDNVYLDESGTVEIRPMPAAEKKAFIQEEINSLGHDDSDSDREDVHNTLDYLIRKGHAPDCPTKYGKTECTCGNTEAEKWIAEHPDQENAIAE